MKISLPDNKDVGEAVGDSNEGMKEARDRYDARQKDESMENSRDLQNMISSGSDIVGRPQDEGYRPNAGTAMDRAMAEGARDSDKITESGDQGFGGPGSSRTVKATPKPAAKPPAKPTAKVEAKPEYKPAIKASEMPSDDTTKSVTDRAKATRERARSGSDSTDGRSVNERIRDSGIGSSISNYFSNFKTPAERKAQERKEKAAKGSYSSGGKVSASSRGDGIAQRGKTRGKMC